MAAGVRVASGWPAGLNSRWLGSRGPTSIGITAAPRFTFRPYSAGFPPWSGRRTDENSGPGAGPIRLGGRTALAFRRARDRRSRGEMKASLGIWPPNSVPAPAPTLRPWPTPRQGLALSLMDVPGPAVTDVLTAAGRLDGKIVIDAANMMGRAGSRSGNSPTPSRRPGGYARSTPSRRASWPTRTTACPMGAVLVRRRTGQAHRRPAIADAEFEPLDLGGTDDSRFQGPGSALWNNPLEADDARTLAAGSAPGTRTRLMGWQWSSGTSRPGWNRGDWASCQVPANERKPTVGERSRSRHVTAHRNQGRY